jgi:hypothetical protein
MEAAMTANTPKNPDTLAFEGLRRRLLLHTAAAASLAGLGVYLAYGPLTSKVWYWDYGAVYVDGRFQNLGGWIEFVRFILLATLFVFAHLWVFRERAQIYWRGRRGHFYAYVYRKSGRCSLSHWCVRVACAVGIVGILVANLYLNPRWIAAEFAAQNGYVVQSVSWDLHIKPYTGYVLYSLACYGMLGIPLLGMIAGAIRRDFESSSKAFNKIGTVLSANATTSAEMVAHHFLKTRNELVPIFDKYAHVAVGAIAYVALEVNTVLSETLNTIEIEILKATVWVFIVLVIPVIAYRVFGVYAYAFDKCSHCLDELGDIAASQGDEALRTLRECREKFDSEYRLPIFARTYLANGSIALTVGALILFFLLKTFADTTFVQGLRRCVPGYPLTETRIRQSHEGKVAAPGPADHRDGMRRYYHAKDLVWRGTRVSEGETPLPALGP